jgi:carbon-monoxide dehydrogenase medium subunit
VRTPIHWSVNWSVYWSPLMKPPPFRYYDPRTLADAIGLLGRLDNAKLLAGGQSLMPMLNMRYVLPDHVIDLNRVDGLSYIREAGGAIEIGAMTRQRELEFSELIRTRLPLMQEAILQIGHRQTRNRGTIGGSLCHLDPAAELVTLGAAYDASVVVTGPNGQREIAFADFPVAYMATAVEPNEILTAVRFTPWPAGHGYAFVEFSRRHGDFAITSAAVLLEADGGGRIKRASVTIGGAAMTPVRAREVEQALVGNVPTPELMRAACESCRAIEAIEDIHAPASYRQHLAAVLSRRALEKAVPRIGQPIAAKLH